MVDFEKIRKKVEEGLKDESSGRDYAHVMRVFKTAVLIGSTMKDIDIDVLKAATLLHDVAYSKKFYEKDYAKKSEDIAKELLTETEFSASQIEKILRAIRNHDIWSIPEKEVDTETMILRDADRMDYLGHTGIVRAVAYAATAKKNFMKVLQKLLELENNFETDKGKELSRTRIKTVKSFIKKLEAEY